MKIVASVSTTDGQPVSGVRVEVVTVEGAVGEGVVEGGQLEASVEKDLPPVWALAIDGQPVLAFPVKADREAIDLGEIVTGAPKGWRWPAFHAVRGRVFGVPKALLELTAQPGEVKPATPEVPMDFTKAVPLRALLDSSTQQLAASAKTTDRLQLTGATITVRGLPSGSGSDFSLSFPEADLAKNVNGLSELSFALRPDFSRLPGTPTVPESEGDKLPDLTGYTRDLAVRKLAAAGHAVTVASEVVTEDRAVGRVVRQLPRAGQAADPDLPVQIFIGKAAGGA